MALLPETLSLAPPKGQLRAYATHTLYRLFASCVQIRQAHDDTYQPNLARAIGGRLCWVLLDWYDI